MGGEEAGSITLGQYLRQLARHQNFLWFVGMDLVQVWGAIPSPLLQGCFEMEMQEPSLGFDGRKVGELGDLGSSTFCLCSLAYTPLCVCPPPHSHSAERC